MLVATRTERLLQSQTVAGGYRLEPQTLALAMFLEVTRSKLACKANQVSAAVLAGFAKQLQGVPPEGARCDPQQMCHLRSRVAADDKLEDARLGWRKAIDHCCRIDDHLRLVIAVGDEHGGDGVSGNASADCPFAQRQDMGDERAAVGSHPGYRNASPTERDIALGRHVDRGTQLARHDLAAQIEDTTLIAQRITCGDDGLGCWIGVYDTSFAVDQHDTRTHRVQHRLEQCSRPALFLEYTGNQNGTAQVRGEHAHTRNSVIGNRSNISMSPEADIAHLPAITRQNDGCLINKALRSAKVEIVPVAVE